LQAALIFNFSYSQTKRPLNPSDFLRYVDVTDPQVSPDGKWCTYTVTTVDTAKDETNT
jgi:dipeptidyl aminopeptidase/acylaminoacyl peptidase